MLEVDIRVKRQGFSLEANFTAKKEVLGILGASGAGKSLTLKCIAGIETPDFGKIVLDGRVLFDSVGGINLPPQLRRVGYLFQDYALFPHMTVRENLAVGIRCQDKEKQLKNLVESFYLSGLEQRYPSELSGGQQQRTALARIFGSKPELLLLDEPLTALDAYLKSQVEAELAVVLQKYSRTTLFVSHSRDEIYRFCDKIAVLADGALEPVRLKAEVFKNPQTLAASRLTGCKNHSRLAVGRPGKVTALDWGGIELVASCDLPAPYAGIRAHDITLAENLCEDNTYEFEVVRVIEEVFSFVLLVRRSDFAGEELRVEGPKEVWQEYAIAGKRAYLKLPPEKIFFLYA